MLEHRDAYEDEVYVKQEVVVGWQRAKNAFKLSIPSSNLHPVHHIPSIDSHKAAEIRTLYKPNPLGTLTKTISTQIVHQDQNEWGIEHIKAAQAKGTRCPQRRAKEGRESEKAGCYRNT